MMKLSIWREFSSNNSAYFTIVGVFRTADEAEATSQQLRSFLDDLEQWHTDHPDESQDMRENVTAGNITERERAMAELHRIDWQYPILWPGNYTMEVFDSFIFLHNNWGADSGAEPVDRLLRKLGALEALVSGDLVWDVDHRMLSVWISCFAPTIEIANTLTAEITGAIRGEGQDERYLRVNIDHDDLAISNGQALKDVISQMQSVGCKPIYVNFEEQRGFSIQL